VSRYYEEDEVSENELDYQDNPANANWPRMWKLRGLFEEGDVLEELVYSRVSISKTVDPKTGKVGYSINGGPQIRVVNKDGGDFYYKTDPYTDDKAVKRLMKEGVSREEAVERSTKVPKPRVFRFARLFTFTSKMSCASFSIPAGPAGPTKHGTCPAATPEAVEGEGSYEEFHPPLSEMPGGAKYVCTLCYAGKAQYALRANVSLTQMARLEWLKKTLANGTFVRKMSEAIGSLLDPDVERLLLSRNVSNKYFRIHDSGDFTTPEYYKAWRDICDQFVGKRGLKGHPFIYFWAPTRQWVFEKFRRTFENYPPGPNFSLRPSGLFTELPMTPRVPGMAAGTTSIAGNAPSPIKDCPAYDDEDGAEKSCAGSRCRTCWSEPRKPVNYRTH
jgi:hypothetical protein